MLGKIVLSLIGLFVLVTITWRLCSQRYSLPCPAWLAWLVESDNPFTKINRAATIIEHSGVQEGMKVLDAGCGPGRVAIPVAHKVSSKGEVVAMDIQADMLRRVQEKAQKENLTNITLLQAGIGDNKLNANTFDRALLISVLGEIPNQKAALKEIFDALKPGGILSVTETIFDPHFQRRAKILRLAGTVGFQEEKTFGSYFNFTLNLKRPI